MTSHRLPLLFDAHHHPAFYASLAGAVDLSGCRDADGVVERLAGEREGVAVALGWNDGLCRLETGDLERVGPALVCNLSLHGFLANAAARRILAERDEEAMERLGDPDFVERNLPRIFALVTAAAGIDEARLTRHFDGLRTTGIRGAEEMHLADPAALEAYRDAGLLDRTRIWASPDLLAALPADRAGLVHGVKLFSDGALGARTAALSNPYRGGGTGILLHDDDGLAARIADAGRDGRPVALHAIGDRATAQAARVARRLADAGALPPLRIEHAQFIDEGPARTLRDLCATLSMQPNFSDDSRHYADRLPDGFAERNNPFRMLIDRAGFRPGVDLLLGSDGMPSGAAAGIAAALRPPHPGQRLTLAEALAGYRAAGVEYFNIEL